MSKAAPRMKDVDLYRAVAFESGDSIEECALRVARDMERIPRPVRWQDDALLAGYICGWMDKHKCRYNSALIAVRGALAEKAARQERHRHWKAKQAA